MSTKDYYVWGHQNDRLESQRLTHQHHVFTDIFDGLLQPSILADLQNRPATSPIRIADIACGNCIWAHQVAISSLATTHPDLHVTALDMTDELYPVVDDEKLENIDYDLWDMYTSPPEKYRGAFDVVNIRLVFGAVKNNDPDPILKNLMQLLKPNGWIQWSEIDFDNPVAPEGSAYLRSAEMFTITRGGHSNAWIPKLGETFETMDLRDVKFRSEMPRPGTMKYWRDNWYIGLLNLVRVVNNEEVNKIWEDCERERGRVGMGAAWPSIMVVGRKA